MLSGLPFLPPQGSTVASQVDTLFLFLIALTAFFGTLIAATLIVFAVKYRRRHAGDVGAAIHGSSALEIAWTAIPFAIAMVIFFWGAHIFFTMQRPPDETLEIYAVGKRWMWKFQHIDGQREINELHIPVGRPVKLTMTSEDVIHDVFVPAFRVKGDAIPGRYSTIWFTATTPGEYHLFCAEYCGTKHSGMIGKVVVMEAAGYQAWLTGSTGQLSLTARGAKLYQDLACNTCHLANGRGRGPSLQGVFQKQITLADGSTVVADESYLRESILNPQAKITAGYQPQMPTFQGLVNEEGLLSLIAYIKTLPPVTGPEEP